MEHMCWNMSSYTTDPTCSKYCCIDRNMINIIYTTRCSNMWVMYSWFNLGNRWSESSVSRPSHLTLGRPPGSHWIGRKENVRSYETIFPSVVKYSILLSRVLVAIDGVWIGWLDLLTSCTINSYLQAIQCYSWFTQFTVHRYTHTLGFSVITSRILVTELKQSHCD
jgi:hypothetical protein